MTAAAGVAEKEAQSAGEDKEGEEEERKPKPDDRTWLQKNWMMLIPAGLLVRSAWPQGLVEGRHRKQPRPSAGQVLVCAKAMCCAGPPCTRLEPAQCLLNQVHGAHFASYPRGRAGDRLPRGGVGLAASAGNTTDG